jgi:HAD superfamily hydrolase (TIGR01509 family)
MSVLSTSRLQIPDTIRGLIFDCDGTLVDSMPLHMQAWEHAMRGFGVRYDGGIIHRMRGMKETEIVALYNQHAGTTLDAHALVAEKHRYFLARIHEVRPFEPVVDVARRYHGILPLAVVSGGVRDIVAGELAANGLDRLFDVVLTADDPLPPKPAPDLFLEAARRMRVTACDCQVFEDGDAGLEAARRAGMYATDVRPFTGC